MRIIPVNPGKEPVKETKTTVLSRILKLLDKMHTNGIEVRFVMLSRDEYRELCTEIANADFVVHVTGVSVLVEPWKVTDE